MLWSEILACLVTVEKKW